ncbi:hypothetical protein QNH48_10185 [Neobacillus sp. YX16]|uniref:hypothetical protein n=1 Tax=Neobacillus sp. YX16 TaxID=3047874 RepID=UPI0024C364B3|nr:hypothetical protein [Neobacillus sp. YX16]WHZ04957.1 hypothetical protein QNH48_10185 [Neobacillus sp. YX16]
MSSLITVRRAKDEIKRLQYYVYLVENYEADTLEKFIIKEYAITNSMFEVTRNLNRRGLIIDGKPVEKEYVSSVITGKPYDELHRMPRSGYLKRTKHRRHK